ncbi:MAG TPA: hypothetical protein VJ801_06115 [Polyangia bacterium]|jgi:hypothetical protein|nr:hypothetical protein [Polyangia bacterium]
MGHTRLVPVRRCKGDRRFFVFTCDRGRRLLSADRDPPERLAAVLQEVVESGFWRELEKFPADVIARLLPRLTVAPNTHGLLEIWIQERSARRPAA